MSLQADRLLERPVEARVTGVEVRRVRWLRWVHRYDVVLVDRVLVERKVDCFPSGLGAMWAHIVVLKANSQFTALAPRSDAPDDLSHYFTVQLAIHAFMNEARGQCPFGLALV